MSTSTQGWGVRGGGGKTAGGAVAEVSTSTQGLGRVGCVGVRGGGGKTAGGAGAEVSTRTQGWGVWVLGVEVSTITGVGWGGCSG